MRYGVGGISTRGGVVSIRLRFSFALHARHAFAREIHERFACPQCVWLIHLHEVVARVVLFNLATIETLESVASLILVLSSVVM
jgi:hypothetical protein